MIINLPRSNKIRKIGRRLIVAWKDLRGHQFNHSPHHESKKCLWFSTFNLGQYLNIHVLN